MHKTLAFIHRNDTKFAVGSFYPVLTVFSYHELGNTVSPFLLLDHIGPGQLKPGKPVQGVHEHPHRGFETVTLVYAGELAHEDSSGGGGIIRAGDVQWMTAGAGIIHKEVFSEAFARQGGRFEMIQLWINLPAQHKMAAPHYQHLTRERIGLVELPEHAGQIRVIAGQFNQVSGAATTYSPLTVLDASLQPHAAITFTAQPQDTVLLYVRSGTIALGDAPPGSPLSPAADTIHDGDLAVLSARGEQFTLHALEKSHVLVLMGQPLQEPLRGHGPFVMNHYHEILQAYDDLKNNRFFVTP